MLAGSVASLTYDDLPPFVVTLAKQCVLDTLGVAIAGASQPAVRLTWETVQSEAATGPCTVLGVDRRAGGAAAALVNGIAAHALDYDDLQMDAMGGHPSAPVLPAVLAAAEEAGTTGRDMLTAFVAGFEAECRVGLAVAPGHYARGFHTTSTVGTFGAAAGAARLLGLDAKRTEQALGIAALSASGVKAMFGTMGKPLQTGRAASAGFLAARLAERGLTSAEDALFCPQGFAATQTDRSDREAVCTQFGNPWHILQVLFKAHASCYGTHASIDAIGLLRRNDGLSADQVEDIEIEVPPQQLHVCAIPRPSTGLEGKFSLTFTTALSLLHGATDESRFTDDAVCDPRIVALIERMRVTSDDLLPALGARVTVRLRNGRTLAAEVDCGAPAWSRDPTEQEERLRAKFRGLVAPVLGADAAAALIDLVDHLEDLDDIRALTKELT
ncbi:MmgE/PrpD family protein [Streptomyces ochraceiscleroticus]|uniref:MmgE/PrpD family protein n=1 Tax=Streptomyces ochraceiscleroticus TaxID=47761 RepID=A0ABW1MJZ0_9ACTN|nr:MmgE/PrpD family protein [Streptomyces ochraceiscleroticus]